MIIIVIIIKNNYLRQRYEEGSDLMTSIKCSQMTFKVTSLIFHHMLNQEVKLTNVFLNQFQLFAGEKMDE